ncbi:Mbov_0389 family ICE element HExxH motif-containing protein [Mycoplasmopsis bovis]|uniref:Mbov_0389 family ICE element HExxH motif-containing protein n=1 Tax=Mycoplasmopsis bovis TaxID=28903 RepID=UPI0032EDDB30
MYLFTPINNKATNEITFSAMKVYDISQTSYKNYKAKKWDENSFKEAIFTLFKDYSIKWIDDIEMQGAKLAIDNLSKYIFINKNYKKWENYLILHEYAHQLANHSSNDRKDILKEYQIIKACEMFINSLEFENEFYKQAYPRYENMQVLTVIKSLSNKEKYKVLDEILTIGYKLIDKFSSSSDILKDEIYG